MNMKSKMHKCAPRNSQINLSAQEFEQCTPSYAQTRRMRTLQAEGKLTDEAIYAILKAIDYYAKHLQRKKEEREH